MTFANICAMRATGTDEKGPKLYVKQYWEAQDGFMAQYEMLRGLGISISMEKIYYKHVIN